MRYSMKHFYIIIWFALLLFLNPKLTFAEEKLNVWVITDLHYLSPSLHDSNGEAIEHIRNTGAGKDLDYGNARMEALILQIEQEKPDALIVSGDLSLNGEYQSMEELAVFFNQIENLGTSVFVIPGNHDISSGWAREFKGEEFLHTRQVLPSDFKELFSSNGYDEAIEADKDSLSYVAAINQNFWVLMIDSNIYSDEEGVGAPKTNGILSKKTLQWIEKIFVQANENNVHVIPVIHHNTVTHFDRLEKNYTLDNASDLRELLFKFNIPFTISGHIHTQHYSQLLSKNHSLTDIVTGAFSSYPSYIGKYSFDSQFINYQAEPLDMANWVEKANQTDPNLINYLSYMKNQFDKSSHQMAFREMIEGGWYKKNDLLLDEVANYVARVNLAFFAGQPLNRFDLSSQKQLEESRQLINEKGSEFFKSYIQEIEQNTHNYTSLNPLSW